MSKMHVGGVGVVLFVRVLTGLLRTGMSVSLCLADSSHEVGEPITPSLFNWLRPASHEFSFAVSLSH
jgi:hypothetical protein